MKVPSEMCVRQAEVMSGWGGDGEPCPVEHPHPAITGPDRGAWLLGNEIHSLT